MQPKCAKLKEVMGLKKAFIRVFGEEQLVKDHDTAMRNRNVQQVSKHPNRGDSE